MILRRRHRSRREPRQPRERKPKEERLFPRIFRFVASTGVEAVVTRFLGPATKKSMGTGMKLGGIAAMAAAVLFGIRGCG